MKKSLLVFIGVLLFSVVATSAQKLNTNKKYSPNIGLMVNMLEDLRGRINRSIKSLNDEGTDYLLDENANRIGAIIMHLAATEHYYQVYTFQKREFTPEEEEEWMVALTLGDKARAMYVGKPIQHYLAIWDEVRSNTLKLLKTKDDKWFAKKTKGLSLMNNHWAWFHVMEHQANHMGQINLIKKRIPKN